MPSGKKMPEVYPVTNSHFSMFALASLVMRRKSVLNVATSKLANSHTETMSVQQWLNSLVGYLMLCVALILGNSAQAQVFTSLQAAGGTVPASATTFNAGIKGNVQVGQYGDAINGVELFVEGNSTPLAYKYYVVGYDKLEQPIDTQRSFDLSAALPPGTYRLYVTASSENGLSANSPIYTVTVSPSPTIMAALNAIFSILLDDDSGTSGSPPSGGTGGVGGTGGTGGSGGTGGTGGTSPGTSTGVNISPPYLTAANAGTLPGEFKVGLDGAATYKISLDVAPGTAGMQPQLGLEYSSSSPNGLVGLGWTLSGFSTIHRCAKTIAQDGMIGRISFDTADRLCLDGSRLVRVNVLVLVRMWQQMIARTGRQTQNIERRTNPSAGLHVFRTAALRLNPKLVVLATMGQAPIARLRQKGEAMVSHCSGHSQRSKIGLAITIH
jgi:uncharacterized membrane protein YgcG